MLYILIIYAYLDLSYLSTTLLVATNASYLSTLVSLER